MRPLLRTLLTISVASVALSACTDRPTSGPTAPIQLRPSFNLSGFPSCNINSLRDLSKLYYAKTNDVAFKIITDLSKLTANSAAATDKAFDGLSRMAVVRGTTSVAGTADAEVFDDLAKGFIGCMIPSILDGVPLVNGVPQVDFAPDFEPGHLFTVRGKSTVDPTGGAYQNGNSQKYWAVETPGNAPWENALSQSPSKRFLVYEASPPATFLNTNGRVGSVTDIATIPTIASGNLKITLNVGLCDVPFTGDVLPPGLRVNHANTYGAYVALACTRGSQLAAARSPFDPRVLAQRAIDFFSPRTLNAAVFGGLGSVGIGLSDISPVGVYDLTAVVLDSLGFIKDGKNSTPLQTTTTGGDYGSAVVVRATATTDGARLQGIPIEMSIQGNQSTIAFFGVGQDTLVTVTRTTDSRGYANFGDVRVTKAGGYTLNFKVHFVDAGAGDVIGAQILPSNPFNIQNKN